MLIRRLFSNCISTVRPHMEYTAPVWDPHMRKDQAYLKALRSLHVKWQLKTGIKATMSFCIWQTYSLLQTEGCTLNCVLCTKWCTTWLIYHQILLYQKSLDHIPAHLLPCISLLMSFVPHAVSHWNSPPCRASCFSSSLATFTHTLYYLISRVQLILAMLLCTHAYAKL